jgi:hypothetical protein
VSGVADYFAATEDESFELARDCVESLNLEPTRDLNIDADEPTFGSDELDVYGGLAALGNSGDQPLSPVYTNSEICLVRYRTREILSSDKN